MDTEIIKLVIDKSVLDRYNEYYFSVHPKARKTPIPHPYHESINQWMIMKRPMMNALKQRWKDMIVWFIEDQGYTDLKIDQCEMHYVTYRGSNRASDVDNTVPKFIQDGFVESGFIVDDDNRHITKLILECRSDVKNPRTEIYVMIKSYESKENE